MSASPMLPDVSVSQPKSFWARPEGKVGMVFLAAFVGGAALMFWSAILPWLIVMVSDTLHLAYLVGILAAIGFLVTNPTIHNRVSLIFRLTMRFLTGLIINIDPIGILKDHLSQMRKRRDEMGEQIASVSGQIRMLKNTIARNKAEADQNMALAEQAKKMANTADETIRLRMNLQMRAKASHAGRLEQSNMSYAQLLAKLQLIYDMLTKWSIHIDFFIEDTDDQVQQAEVQYKTVNSAYKAYRTALSVIKGNTDENEIYNTTMERLADDADRKLGEMEDFQRTAQNFMDSIDVQNGAVETEALAKLNQYEQKVLTSGDQDMAFLKPSSIPEKVAVPAAGAVKPGPQLIQ